MSLITLIRNTTCYCYYTPYTNYFVCLSIVNCWCLLSTVLSDDDMGPHNQDDEQDPPAGMRTPPTPPPPGSLIQARVRAVEQHQPVSIPDIASSCSTWKPRPPTAARRLQWLWCALCSWRWSGENKIMLYTMSQCKGRY